MKQSIFGFTAYNQSIVIMAFGFLLTITIIYGLTGKYNGEIIPGEYNILIGK